MKKIISAFFLSALISNTTDAQIQATLNPADGGGQINTNPAQKPFLSDEQQKKVEGINSYYNDLKATLTEAAGYSTQAISEKQNSLELERIEKLRQVLSPEQFNQLMSSEKLVTENLSMISKQVGLSDEQARRLADLNSSFADKENKIIYDNNMSPEEKQKSLAFVRTEKQENLQKILTPEQMKKIAAWSNSAETISPAAAPVKKAATVAPAKNYTPAAKPAKKS